MQLLKVHRYLNNTGDTHPGSQNDRTHTRSISQYTYYCVYVWDISLILVCGSLILEKTKFT